MENKEIASNRRAYYDYEVIESFEAGIVLVGTEVKSLREGGGNLQDGYVKIAGRELFLSNVSIIPYRFGNVYNHEERRERKLLLHKREIERLKSAIAEKGLTLVPLSLYFKEGKIKVKIALVRGKKQHDRRKEIKERESDREIRRALRRY